MGGVSVAIFFSISAYIFGQKWEKNGYVPFAPVHFIKSRILRIYIPLWIVLIIVLPMEIHANHQVDMKQIVFNIVGLGWAKPFIWAGHLWYITMIMILYFIFIGLSYIRIDNLSKELWQIVFVGLFLICIGFPNIFSTFSSIAIPLTILYSSLLFAQGDKLVCFLQKHKWQISILSFFTLIVALSFYWVGWHETHKALAFWSSTIAGVLLFLSLYVCCPIKKDVLVVSWFSKISYEVYLIHPLIMILCRKLEGNGLDYYLISIVMIVLTSYILHQICERVYNVLR